MWSYADMRGVCWRMDDDHVSHGCWRKCAALLTAHTIRNNGLQEFWLSMGKGASVAVRAITPKVVPANFGCVDHGQLWRHREGQGRHTPTFVHSVARHPGVTHPFVREYHAGNWTVKLSMGRCTGGQIEHCTTSAHCMPDSPCVKP